MCQTIGGIAVKAGESLTVYTLKDSDSHKEIREAHNIGDGMNAAAQYQTPVELMPVRGVEKLSEMVFRFDAGRPAWWTDEMTTEASRQLFRAWRERWKGNTLRMTGSLNLDSLTKVEKGVTLEAGGGLNLHNLTTLPDGVTLKAGDYLDLDNLTTIEKGVTLKAGDCIYLRSLTTLPTGVTLKAGGYIYINNLTTTEKGCRLSAKGLYHNGTWHKTSRELRRSVAAQNKGE